MELEEEFQGPRWGREVGNDVVVDGEDGGGGGLWEKVRGELEEGGGEGEAVGAEGGSGGGGDGLVWREKEGGGGWRR